jgi:type II secretory pathway component GspD/PulD (secretin)
MVFQARKWGWKRLVANLLLIPVLGGWTASVAHAQFNSGPSPVTGNAPAIGMPSGEPKTLLKEGRKALAAGQFDRAQDLARSAEANNPTGKWGLFDDTPRSLMEDIQKAVAKHKKAQAEQCMKEAKSLFAKPGSDAERLANLDHAFQLCHQAEALHGPYSAWDFGERPDKLAKEIKAAHDRIQPTAATTPAGMTSGTGPGGSAFAPSPGSPAATSGGRPVASATDPKKASAIQLMNDARKLADQGMFGQARAKLSEADRVGAIFAPNEYTPTFAIQELNNRGAGAIERLVVEARNQMAKKDFARAEAALNGAAEIATALGLFTRPIAEAREQLLAAAGGKTGTPTPSFNPTTGPGTPVSPVGPGPMTPLGQGPTNPPGIATVGGRPVAAPGSAVTGRQMLDQAAYEYSRGELEMATTLARQAYNLGGVKDEATSLLNSIDAERFAQKKLTATRSFEAAQASVKNRDYNNAIGVLVLIDPNMLPPEAKTKHAELINECRTALAASGSNVATAGAVGTQPGGAPPAMPPTMPPGMMPPGMNDPTSLLPGTTPPGTARVGDPKAPTGTGSADNVATQQDALRKVQFQKLRSEGLKVQADAQAAYGRGEADLAIQILVDYANRVRASGLMAADIALLMRPIDSRLELFRIMRGQVEAIARQNKESRDIKEMMANRNLADEQRHAEVAKLVKQYHELVKKNDFAAAEKVAMQAKQLEPDDPALGALALMAKMHKRVNEEKARKDAREELFYRGLGDAEDPGPYVTIDDPVAIRLERNRRSRSRGSLDESLIRTRTPAEHIIETKLERPMTIDINHTPLDQAIDHLRSVAELPISIDDAAIEAEGINLHKPVTEKLQTPVATKHVLAVILEKGGLSYVVENDMVKVTTTKKAKGRLFTKVFSVADLVTPVPNFAIPDYANFEKMINKNALNSGNVHIQGLTGTTPRMPAQGLNSGSMVSTPQAPGVNATSPGISGGLNFGPAGQLQTNSDAFASTPNPLGASASLAGERNTKHEQLIKLITSMVRPYSWDGMGGPGRIEYFDIGSALVVNQVADVIQEVADLLEALRRLQDLAIAVEIRIVSLSETWYERMGVDFAMNILTHNNQFEPALTQVDPNTGLGGVFRPLPFINSNQFQGVTVGLTPAGNFTNDLGVPIAPGTFNMAVPPFGGFPNTPGQNGGISFGLAFLNDIQVYLLMEAAAGDRRVNVMQAPKLTLFNGQTATLAVTSTEFFVTNVTVVSVNGQLVFIPTNTPLAGPDTNFNIAIQAVVSADRRFVRLNLPVNLSAQTGATVPLFPITTFITPIFEGGSQGVPIPFTQFLQQPSFTSLNISTTVICPDGGTVLLGGLKTLQEGRNEFGPPFLSNIPYLNRLFKNVGIGRQTTHIMIMVTPRIIINSEEEIFQTEGRQPGTLP